MSTDTDPAVELVARALYACWLGDGTQLPEAPTGPYERLVRQRWTGMARSALAALAALRRDGSALPPVVQTREEWGEACAPPECPLPHEKCCYADGHAHKHTHVRTISTLADDGSPYGGATLTGKWRNVDG